ncbi:hypothetical protein V8C42DRAFT_312291 [Trichoderma barbatum]
MPESFYALRQCALCQFEAVPEEGSIIIDDSLRSQRSQNPISYHQHCFHLVAPRDTQHLKGLVEAMRHSYPTTLQQRDTRRRQIRSCLRAELLLHFASSELNLPLELWDTVAEDLLSYYASANLQRLWIPTSDTTHASIAQDIWCKYIDFEGTRYIAALSNVPSDNDWKLIFQPLCDPVLYIFVGETHLGITQLLFSTSGNSPSANKADGIWWRTIHVNGRDLTIRGKSDGIKLRYLLDADQDITAWSVPQPNELRFEYFITRSANQAPARMVSLACNHTSIVGYSILWASGIISIHAHEGHDDVICYQTAPRGSWLHLPIDPNEVIIEIWQRRSRLFRNRALGIKTSTGRVFIAGIYTQHLCCSKGWSLIDRPCQKQIFFEASDTEITALAFESDSPIPPMSPFSIYKPSGNSVYTNIEDFFYSDHDLAGLVAVTPCKHGKYPGYTGMLLHFSNGHRESVGQVRLDCLCPPISLENSTSLFLAFNRRNSTHPYVAAIMATPSSPDLNFETAIELTFDGKLEWFWSCNQCHVVYKDQKSPRTV